MNDDNSTALDNEISAAKQKVNTDQYPISIGELINIYNDGDLVIQPEYQRLFRWTITQQSNLIESILTGLPIPPIFVFERDDGKWELIDGLQRISTILRFVGVRKNENDELEAPSTLVRTRYLSTLEGLTYDSATGQNSFTAAQQRSFKRASIGAQILKKGSDEGSKFELFQRLNSYGSLLKPQEFRTCLMVLVDQVRTSQLRQVADETNTIDLFRITTSQLSEQQNLDYVCRTLAHSTSDLTNEASIDEFITNKVNACLSNENFDLDNFLTKFRSVRDKLIELKGGDALRRYVGDRHIGRVGKVAFEVIFMGIFVNFDHVYNKNQVNDFLNQQILQFWNDTVQLEDFTSAGLTGTVRVQRTIPYGRELFSQ